MNMPDVLAGATLRSSWRSMPRALLWLAAGLLLLGWMFHEEIAAAVTVWSTSTAYNHCFLVLPIAGYLVWDRREALNGVRVQPIPMLALAGIPLAVVWLAAERLGIMEGRQLAAMRFVELLCVTVLGWRLSWALAGPLLYLYFLVPFGAFITPQLQDFTTDFVQAGLNLLHIPVFIDGYTIDIPQGSFYIAEACAGLRFLIASIAFGVLYALVMYRSPVRRGVFMLASVIVPVIANGLRALGIVSLATVLGSAQAAATDHVLYGWLFFSIVILILIALGLPFREDQGPVQVSPKLRSAIRRPEPEIFRRGAFAAAAVCAVAVIGPAVALALEPNLRILPNAVSALDFGPSCHAAAQDPAGPPLAPGVRRISCDGLPLQVRMAVLPHRITAGPLMEVARGMVAQIPTEEGVVQSWFAQAAGQPPAWQVTATPDLSAMIAESVWVEGQPTQAGVHTRLRMAWTSLTGTDLAPVVITAEPKVDWANLTQEQRREVERHLVRVVQGWPGMAQQVRRIAGRN